MRNRNLELERLENALIEYSESSRQLVGIQPADNRLALAQQLIDSIRRVEYVHVIRERNYGLRQVPSPFQGFDPLKAAAIHSGLGNTEEACWLVFLLTHFGKHRSSGWRLVQEVYGALGDENMWTWDRIIQDPDGLDTWLSRNIASLTSRSFGNHRKYETLEPTSGHRTGIVISTYVRWIQTDGGGSHQELFNRALSASENDARTAFRWLFNSMQVHRFGRTAKFDYLTMLAKLGLAPIEADSAYLVDATGPLRGARLLFGGRIDDTSLSLRELDRWLIDLSQSLGVGMQVIEDALCNWQKSPSQYRQFRG